MTEPLSLEHPVIGVRVWRRHITGAELRSWALAYDWKPGVNSTTMANDTVLGFHACHDIEFLACGWTADAWRKSHHGQSHVGGIIRGWGQVFCHPNGWRSEHAEVLAFFPNSAVDLSKLAERYEVPIVPRNPIVIEEFGQGVPKELWPEPSNPVREYKSSLGQVSLDPGQMYFNGISPPKWKWTERRFWDATWET